MANSCRPIHRFLASRNFAFIICFMVCQWSISPVYAHDVSRSESHIVVQGEEVHVEIRLNLLELGYVDTKGDGFVSVDELDNAITRIYSDVRSHFILDAPDPPVHVTLENYRVIEDHVGDLQMVYRFSHPVTQIIVTCRLDQITQPRHQHLISATFNGDIYEAALNASSPTATLISGGPSTFRTFRSFLRLGVMHILTGYDHLAFLVGLLVVTKRFGPLLKIITAFTLAHSITLGLATFDVVVLPSRLTESVIALSIAYVALENLLGKRAIERYRIVFVFGLAHGFGFSNVLREMELSHSHLALSLFSFNLGVEVGQIAFVLVFFPLIVLISSFDWRQRFQHAVSIAVLSLALYWFVQRAFLV